MIDTFYYLLSKLIRILLLLSPVLLILGFKIRSQKQIAIYLTIIGIFLGIILTFDYYFLN